ncbi:hypothetical protein [Glutamicibacter nicotianae]|uniref:hypothetical protein n=1 Tax=Glutamicibacter nicotianae TaxID=37929 RepID=UPI0031E07833
MTQQIALGQKLIVSPPATSANLGPGFDSLGLAWNTATALRWAPRTPAASRFSVTGPMSCHAMNPT